jgi:arylformamidase
VKIHDISRPLGKDSWTWPGDTPFDCSLAWKISEGAPVNVGRVTMSCHTGTHMDAPFHFAVDGATSEHFDLSACFGPCQVLPLDRLHQATAERVLVRSGDRAPSVEQLEWVTGPLRLFGTDWHSVDPLDSKTLEAHHRLWKMGAVILEELDLSLVPDGEYELVALPLRLVGMDAAPVRAVLIEKDG